MTGTFPSTTHRESQPNYLRKEKDLTESEHWSEQRGHRKGEKTAPLKVQGAEPVKRAVKGHFVPE